MIRIICTFFRFHFLFFGLFCSLCVCVCVGAESNKLQMTYNFTSARNIVVEAIVPCMRFAMSDVSVCVRALVVYFMQSFVFLSEFSSHFFIEKKIYESVKKHFCVLKK